MSLKKRATQCSGYIPASQYVPVYSRPHRTTTGRWHEELSPITPKPNLDDANDSRTQSIHEAVKAWLESSPTSVIGPLYRCRSPSSGSPPSCDSSFDRANMIPSGSGASSMDPANSSPTDLDDNHITTISFAIQKRAVQPTVAMVQNSLEARQNDANPQGGRADSSNIASLEEGKPRQQTEEGAAVHAGDTGRYVEELSITEVEASRSAPEAPMRSQAHGIVSPSEVEKKSGSKRVTFALPPGTANTGTGTDEAGGFVSEAKPDTVENLSSAVSATGVEGRRPGGGKIWKKDSRSVAIGSMRRAEVAALVDERIESAASTREERNKSGNLPAVGLRGTSSVAGCYKFWTVSNSRRMQPSYNLGSGGNASRHVAPQPVYDASDLRGRSIPADIPNGRKADGSMRHPIAESLEHQLKISKSIEKSSTASQGAVERARTHEMETSAVAWEDARNKKFFYRYKGEENKIHAWEERQIAKASVTLNKIEMELEKKRARAMEKMRNEVAKTQKKAAEMKAAAEARRAEKAAKAAVQAQVFRVIGKSPLSCFCFSPIVDRPDE